MMETEFRFYWEGVEVKRSVFVYDEGLRGYLRMYERAIKKLYEQTGMRLAEVSLHTYGNKNVKCVVRDERSELVEEFGRLVGK
jgi:hypothetical protein